MVTFCLETKMGQFTPETVVFKEAIDQYNWLYPASHMDAIYFNQSDWDTSLQAAVIAKSSGVENVIPVGSLEFVRDFCTQYFGVDGPQPKALNVPPELRQPKYTHRELWDVRTSAELKTLHGQHGDLLVKHGRTPKAFELSKYTGKETYPDGEPLFVSAPFEDRILSEWRVFCLNGKMYIETAPAPYEYQLYHDGVAVGDAKPGPGPGNGRVGYPGYLPRFRHRCSRTGELPGK